LQAAKKEEMRKGETQSLFLRMKKMEESVVMNYLPENYASIH
jgi:hypothetical protein